MKQVFLSGQGEISVFDVPIPARLKDSILVRNQYSLISSGTEGAAVTRHSGLLGLYEKALSSGDRAQQVWSMAKKQGLRLTYEIVRKKLSDHKTIGYSTVGTVVETDSKNMPFRPGDIVACMGSGYACHAEYIVVPRNLAAIVPAGVEPEQASFAALACVAMQGIRRLELTPGERIGVIGLGLIGQIAIRLLAGMGFRPYGMDLSNARVAVARRVPDCEAWTLEDCDSIQHVQTITNNAGLDGVLVCAATDSNAPVNLAFELCRKSGRVSIVGDVGLNLERAKMYAKELDVRMSCSYGPGRYDPEYEEGGRDYPVTHLRWSEGRNLEHFLWMLHSGKFDLGELITGRFPIAKASEAYRQIKSGSPETIGVLFDYGELPTIEEIAREVREGRGLDIEKATSPSHITHLGDGVVRLGIIGVGGYVKNMHLPNLKKLKDDFSVRTLVSRTGASAANTARRFKISSAGSDHRIILDDPNIDAVLIGTRHATHARFVLEALDAGKHVFVEKPMATSIEDAEQIFEVAERKGLIVRVGFNRRFSPHIHALRDTIGRTGIRIFYARVNIGTLDKDWSNTKEEGGRLLGEGVHFYDLANWFMGSEPSEVKAGMAGAPESTNPNASVLLNYPDGSHANILYTTLGDKRMGKEFFEVFGNGKSSLMADYTRLKAWGNKTRGKLPRGDKGQVECLREFAQTIRGREHPVQGADARAGLVATRIALKAIEQSRSMSQK